MELEEREPSRYARQMASETADVAAALLRVGFTRDEMFRLLTEWFLDYEGWSSTDY